MLLLSSLLVASAAAAPDLLHGDWQCDTYRITRPGFVVSVSSRVKYLPGGTYRNRGIGTYTFENLGEVKIEMEFSGLWKLDGDLLSSRTERVEIIRVEPPIVSTEAAEVVVKGGAKFGTWRESRVVSIGESLVTEPLEPVEGQLPLRGSCSKT